MHLKERALRAGVIDNILYGFKSPKPIEEPSLPNLPYTPGQLFWITYGQNKCLKLNQEGLDLLRWQLHPHESYRVNGVLANSPFFWRDFNCQAGSSMNPEKKCRVWDSPEDIIKDLA